MELLNPSVSNRHLFTPRSSFFTRKFSFKTCKTKIPSKSHKNLSVPFHLSFFTTRIVLVSAHFGRPTNRRNSLRKKHVDDQQVRQKNPISLNPSSDFQNPNIHFDNFGSSQETLDHDSLEGIDSSYGVGLVEPGWEKTWKTKPKELGESVLSTKLEDWVHQYNKDTAYWGLGSSPIFTLFHDLKGNVKRVIVDEDEILKRSQVKKRELGDITKLNSKISYAKDLARRMEEGGNVIPRNSSVAKFVVSREESGFVNSIRDAVFQPQFVPVLSGLGKLTFCGFVAIWALKKLFTSGNKKEQLTEVEKEMMRRKIKSRQEKEMLEKGRVEVVQEPSELPMLSTEKPKLDKQELMRNILDAKASKDNLVLVDSSGSHTTSSMDFDKKIPEIGAMAREAREIQSGGQPMVNKNREEKQSVKDESSGGTEMFEKHTEEVSSISNTQNGESGQRKDIDEITGEISLEGSEGDDTRHLNKVSSEKNGVMHSSCASSVEVSKDRQTMARGEVTHSSDTPDGEWCLPKDKSFTMKPRIIMSVKEAREFLAKSGSKRGQEPNVNKTQEKTIMLSPSSDKVSCSKTSQRVETSTPIFGPVNLGGVLDPSTATNFLKDSILEGNEMVSVQRDDSNDSKEEHGFDNLQNSQTLLNGDINDSKEGIQPVQKENWMEKNFIEVEPIIEKIGDGFRDNYKIAKEKVNQHSAIDLSNLNYDEEDSELEWMKDDDLREIVFQVRENELAGRDPFHLMDAEDKLKFFKGLEEKVEKENEKLFQVHEYLHSNIENLDYGAGNCLLINHSINYFSLSFILKKKRKKQLCNGMAIVCH